jgi:hypothetical protein
MSALPPKADIPGRPLMSALCQKRTCDVLWDYKLYWPPMLGSDARVTGGGFHLPVSTSDLGA